MKNYICKFIEDNKKSIVIILFCICIGLISGIIAYQLLESPLKQEIVDSLNKTLEGSKEENFEGINVIKNGFFANILIIVAIYICSITLVCPILVALINILKGFSIGIFIPTIFQVFGFGTGTLALLLLVILPNIIYIPALVYISCNGISFHYDIFDLDKSGLKLGKIIKQVYIILIGLSIMSLSVVIEQFSSVGAISLFLKIQ